MLENTWRSFTCLCSRRKKSEFCRTIKSSFGAQRLLISFNSLHIHSSKAKFSPPPQKQQSDYAFIPHLIRSVCFYVIFGSDKAPSSAHQTNRWEHSRLLQVEGGSVLRLYNKAVTKIIKLIIKRWQKRTMPSLNFSMLDQSSIVMHIVQRNRFVMLTIFKIWDKRTEE